MVEFVKAALTLVLTGLAIAIVCAGCAGKKRSKREEDELQRRITIGMLLGLGFGAMLNNANLWDSHILGLALGPLWGMAIAVLIDEEKTNRKNKIKKPPKNS